jgi:hypothetical protein
VAGWLGGWVAGWVGGCSGVIIRLNSVQLQMQLPAGTELGNKMASRIVFSLGIKKLG